MHAYVNFAACLYQFNPIYLYQLTVAGPETCLKIKTLPAQIRVMNKPRMKFSFFSD